jgi:Domain of unknown function DUF29
MFSIDQDFHGWLLDQAAALRQRDYESVDWDNLAEEIEGMAAQQRRELKARLVTLLVHLLKLKFEPGEIWRHNGWRNTIVEDRRQILFILEDSPGVFQGKRDEVVAVCYRLARKDAARAADLLVDTFPEVCPWSYEQVIDDDFCP